MKVELTLIDKRVTLGQRVLRMFALALVLLAIAYWSFRAGGIAMFEYLDSWPNLTYEGLHSR